MSYCNESVSTTGSTSTVCHTCGVDVRTAFQQMDAARRKLELLQEKLQVDQELLKQEKKNFKRRLRATKVAAANSQAEGERMQMEAKQSVEDSKQRLQRCEEELNQLKKVLEEEKQQHKQQMVELEVRILTETKLQKELKENAEAESLRNELEEMKIRVEEYEMQLLEVERQRDDGSADCISCRSLQRQLSESERRERVLSQSRQASQSDLLELDTVHQTTVSQLEQARAEVTNLTALLQQRTAELDNIKVELAQKASECEKHCRSVVELKTEVQALKADAENGKSSYVTVSVPLKPSDPRSPRHSFEIDLEWVVNRVGGQYTGWVDQEKIPSGSGTLRLDDGAVYDGEFHAGEYHGSGVLATVEGDIYHGEWTNGKRHGQGVLVWSDGRVYRGEFFHGVQHGKGTMTWPYGARYKGQFENDKRSGDGQYWYADGRCFQGTYKDDRPNGYGVLRSAEGETLYDGDWECGEFVGVSCQSVGSLSNTAS